jgi:hypothetical protein
VATVSVRYFVDDVDAAIAFYTQNLASTSNSTPHLASRSFREATCDCS